MEISIEKLNEFIDTITNYIKDVNKNILGTSYWLEKDYIDKLIEDLFD